MANEGCCSVIFFTLMAVFVAMLFVSPSRMSTATNDVFDTTTCYVFSRDYLGLSDDILTMSMVCIRIAIIMETDSDDQKSYFYIDGITLRTMCETLSNKDPFRIPHSLQKYAFITFKHICNNTYK